jgi:hypothetical protein
LSRTDLYCLGRRGKSNAEMEVLSIAGEDRKRIEQHYRVRDVVRLLGLSERTVRRLIEQEPGVRVMAAQRGSRRRKRRYTTCLVPESVLERMLRRMDKTE